VPPRIASLGNLCKYCEDDPLTANSESLPSLDVSDASDASEDSFDESKNISSGEDHDDDNERISSTGDGDFSFWQNLLEETSTPVAINTPESTIQNRQLNTVLEEYTDLAADVNRLQNDPTHKLIMKTKRKFEKDENENALQMALKRRRREIEKAVFENEDQNDQNIETDRDSADDSENESEYESENILWKTFLEKSIEENYANTSLTEKDIHEDVNLKENLLKTIKKQYVALTQHAENLNSDPIHIKIQKSKEKLFKEQNDDGEVLDENEAFEMAVKGKRFLIKKAIFAESISDSESDSETESDNENDTDSNTSEGGDKWLVDIFLKSIEETFPGEDVSQKANEILDNPELFETILKMVRKKYLELILLKNQLDAQLSYKSDVHTKVSNSYDFYDADDDELSSDDDSSVEGADIIPLTKKQKWQKALKHRTFAIKKAIIANWPSPVNEHNEDSEEELD
jgi:hypothetical protein